MDDITYDGIYMFLRMQVYPEFIQNNEDRNARSHWKSVFENFKFIYFLGVKNVGVILKRE